MYLKSFQGIGILWYTLFLLENGYVADMTILHVLQIKREILAFISFLMSFKNPPLFNSNHKYE